MRAADVPVTVARRPMIYDGQLGVTAIRKLVITVDVPQGRAWAKFAE